jgi:hypothetical protein
MTLKLFRPLQSAYELLSQTKVQRAFRSGWNAAATVLFGLDDARAASYWIGDAGVASPVPASLAIYLEPGVAIQYAKSGENHTSDYQPIIIDEQATIPFEANGDASGNDRIDVLAVRAVITESEPQSVDVLDPVDDSISKKTRNQTAEYNWEYVIVQGVVDAVPVAPSVPSGYMPVAEVLVRNAATSFLTSDITDTRVTDTFVVNSLRSAGNIIVGNTTNAARLVYDQANSRLRLEDLAAALHDLEAGNLIATTFKATGIISGNAANDRIYMNGEDGTLGEGNLIAKTIAGSDEWRLGDSSEANLTKQEPTNQAYAQYDRSANLIEFLGASTATGTLEAAFSKLRALNVFEAIALGVYVADGSGVISFDYGLPVHNMSVSGSLTAATFTTSGSLASPQYKIPMAFVWSSNNVRVYKGVVVGHTDGASPSDTWIVYPQEFKAGSWTNTLAEAHTAGENLYVALCLL